ncbi:hypothetical protein [Amycolatopsis benzoatilytica]|uniref:hypothetical protein n=1 Tax=Amycolatopsis benzoatilytica TaxID=346045 RepID=UPI0003A128AB|nr:hypothetical protein [Amycolatopsis benzoatilytica]
MTTLEADLAALFERAGLVDLDPAATAADEHLRSAAYRRVVEAAARSGDRTADRALAAVLVRDPEPLTAKTAAVELVDQVAGAMPDGAAFSAWAASILPETDRLSSEKDREFLRQRVRDWTLWLATETGDVPTSDELAAVSDWMQRRLADLSDSLPVLALLAAHARTKKTRNTAVNRAKTLR